MKWPILSIAAPLHRGKLPKTRGRRDLLPGGIEGRADRRKGLRPPAVLAAAWLYREDKGGKPFLTGHQEQAACSRKVEPGIVPVSPGVRSSWKGGITPTLRLQTALDG